MGGVVFLPQTKKNTELFALYSQEMKCLQATHSDKLVISMRHSHITGTLDPLRICFNLLLKLLLLDKISVPV